MIVITGKSGVGKTAILNFLNFKNIFFADDFVKKVLYKNDHEVATKIYKLFPQTKGNDFVDTKKLGKILFNNKNTLDKIHSLVSPYVIKKIKSLESNYIVEMSVYINYEHIYKNLFDKVILIERDFEDLNKFNHIKNMKQPIEDNKIKYDFKILNNDSIKQASNKLKQILSAEI